MIYYFYPLESVWGSLGEWAAAIVALVTGFAVWRLGTKANAIATSAQDISDRADRREGRLLLISFSTDIRRALDQVQKAQAYMGANLTDSLFATDKVVRQQLHRDTLGMTLPSVEISMKRLHVLPDKAGSALAKALGIQKRVQWDAFHAIEQVTEKELQAKQADLLTMLEDLERELQTVETACRLAST